MIQYLYLGRIGYDEALALQQEIVELRHQGLVENVLLLLEHPPVLTLGRNSNRSNILATDEMLARKGVSIHDINRGGDVTYHGPGQLVGYPIFDLRSLKNSTGGRLGPVDYVRRVEEAMIRLCAGYGVLTGRVPGRTGVWTMLEGREKKIGAIGVHVSRGITSHGFAFNLTTDLRDFQWIVPCGIADREVTSLELEISPNQQLPTLPQLADVAARMFGHVFDEPVLAVESLEALRAGAESRRAKLAELTGLTGPAAAAQETIEVPVTVPKEVERLIQKDAELLEKPVRA